MSGIRRGLENASYLVFGNIISQILSLVGFIYIARLLGPEQYGVYNTVTAFVSLFTVFTFSGLNRAVLRECAKDLSKMRAILERTLWPKLLCSFLALVLASLISNLTKYDHRTTSLIMLYSLDLVLLSIRDVLFVIYQASQKMQYISLFTVLRIFLSIGFSILVLALGFGVKALIIIHLCSSSLILTVNYLTTRKIVTILFIPKLTIGKSLLKQGITFSLLNFLNTLSSKIDLVMLSFLTTPLNVGIYAVAFRIVARSNLIRSAISTSFFPVFVQRFSRGPMKIAIILKRSLLLAVCALAISILLFFTADPIINFLFGPSYQPSIPVLKVLGFYLVLSFIIIPFGLALQTTHNENISVFVGSIRAVMNIGFNLLFFHLFGVIGIAYSTLITFAVSSGLLLSLGYRQLRRQGHLI